MEIDRSAEIVRHEDGSLVVPLAPKRAHDGDRAAPTGDELLLRPGEGGYDEALTAWDAQHHPEHAEPVSTADGRRQAMHAIHEVAASRDNTVDDAVAHLTDPEASAEALRLVLIGGVHAVEDFTREVAAAEGDDPLPAHQATRIIGEVLAKIE